jgi:hypothetical protein
MQYLGLIPQTFFALGQIKKIHNRNKILDQNFWTAQHKGRLENF